MSRFIQLHLLTSYPPANLNRDDLGRPKTAKMGGVDRLRISSQSLKRAWRTSENFENEMCNHLAIRTKRLGIKLYKDLIDGGVREKNALEWAKSIVGVFGANKKKDRKNPLSELEIEQLAHIAPEEEKAVNALVHHLIEGNRAPEKDELKLLRHSREAVDIALFGRMLAATPQYNVEAACQVAHSISVHPVVIEDDYFTAVDDLNEGRYDMGAAHIGETGFAAGLFYSYICINKALLIENLGGKVETAENAVSALTKAALMVAPSGKQNSFASRAYASFVLTEVGDQQPRNLSVAFLKPVDSRFSSDFQGDAIRALQEQRDNFDKVYGPCSDRYYEMNAVSGEGRLKELLAFLRE